MKYFTSSFLRVPNKAKALYIVWFFIHFILLLISGNGFSEFDDQFYPIKEGYNGIEYVIYYFDQKTYDYSEFLIYILSPVFISVIIYLWRKK